MLYYFTDPLFADEERVPLSRLRERPHLGRTFRKGLLSLISGSGHTFRKGFLGAAAL